MVAEAGGIAADNFRFAIGVGGDGDHLAARVGDRDQPVHGIEAVVQGERLAARNQLFLAQGVDGVVVVVPVRRAARQRVEVAVGVVGVGEIGRGVRVIDEGELAEGVVA